jgi:hypothetical protein
VKDVKTPQAYGWFIATELPCAQPACRVVPASQQGDEVSTRVSSHGSRTAGAGSWQCVCVYVSLPVRAAVVCGMQC